MLYRIEWTIKRQGQVRPYADSVYEYEIESDLKEAKVRKFCTEILKPSENIGSGFTGACSFPFGLNSYYSFWKTGDNSYNYKVCCPYTG